MKSYQSKSNEQSKPSQTSKYDGHRSSADGVQRMQTKSASLSHREIINLQRSIGNHAVQRLLGKTDNTLAENSSELRQRFKFPIQAKASHFRSNTQSKTIQRDWECIEDNDEIEVYSTDDVSGTLWFRRLGNDGFEYQQASSYDQLQETSWRSKDAMDEPHPPAESNRFWNRQDFEMYDSIQPTEKYEATAKEQYTELINEIPNIGNAQILEIGSGEGRFINQIAPDNIKPNIQQTEPGDEAFETLQENTPNGTPAPRKLAGKQLAQEFTNKFDIVLSLNVLDVLTLEDFAETIASISKILSTEGRIVHICDVQPMVMTIFNLIKKKGEIPIVDQINGNPSKDVIRGLNKVVAELWLNNTKNKNKRSYKWLKSIIDNPLIQYSDELQKNYKNHDSLVGEHKLNFYDPHELLEESMEPILEHYGLTITDHISGKVMTGEYSTIPVRITVIGKPTTTENSFDDLILDNPFGNSEDNLFGKYDDNPFSKYDDNPFGKYDDNPFGKYDDNPFSKYDDNPFGTH